MIRFLQSPGKVKKYLLGGLLVFISITMLLYLIPQGGSNITGQPNILARVGDDNITIEDVARRAEEFQRSQGRQIPPAMMGNRDWEEVVKFGALPHRFLAALHRFPPEAPRQTLKVSRFLLGAPTTGQFALELI